MSNSEIIAYILLLATYIVVALLRKRYISDNICCRRNYMFKDDNVVSVDNENYVVYNRREVSFTYAFLWIFIEPFKLGKELGKLIYDNFIIKNNEENRIASWFI